MIFNNYQKLIAGVLALVLVAGMTSPAFAGGSPFDPVCPDDCEDLALERLFEEFPECRESFDERCDKLLFSITLDCQRTADEKLCPVPVAGELLSLDSSALVIGGLSSMIWMVPAVAGIVGAGIYLVKFRVRE